MTYGTYFYGGGYSSCPTETIRVQLYDANSRISGDFETRCAGTLYLQGTLGANTQFRDGVFLTVDLWFANEEEAAGRLEGRASSAAIYVSSRATQGATKLNLSR